MNEKSNLIIKKTERPFIIVEKRILNDIRLSKDDIFIYLICLQMLDDKDNSNEIIYILLSCDKNAKESMDKLIKYGYLELEGDEEWTYNG